METLVKISNKGPFRDALKQRVNGYFQSQKIQKRDNLSLYAKASFFLIGDAVAYIYLVFYAHNFWSVAASALCLCFFLLGTGFNIQHDGNHGGFSKSKVINRATGMTLDLLGTSSAVWKKTHNYWHHTFTNIPLHDGDMEFSKYVRLSPKVQLEKYHKYQHLYVWGFYALAHISFLFVDYTRLHAGKAGVRDIDKPKGLELFLFVLGKTAFYTLAFVLPFWLNPFWPVVITYLAISIGIGLSYQLVAESAHIVEGVDHPAFAEGRAEMEFKVHQVRTTANFATTNWFWTFYLGGLNYQREHHLFPEIAHVHYPAISRIVKDVCDEFGVKYVEFKTFREALYKHYCFVKAMGS